MLGERMNDPVLLVGLLQFIVSLFTYMILREWSDRFLHYALVISLTPTLFYTFLEITGSPKALNGAMFSAGLVLIAIVFSAQLSSE